MAKSATIRARVEPELKAEAEDILERLGLTVTQAVTLFFRQMVFQRRLPLDVALPDATTLRVFEETDPGRRDATLSWEQTYRQMAAEKEDWSDWLALQDEDEL